MTRLFETPSDLSEYLFRIVDNGGASADRYTVVFSDGSYLALSGNPSHPQGFSQWGEGIDPQTLEDWVENGEAVDLALGDLPEGLAMHIVSRNNEGLQDFLDLVEARDPKAVAANRDAAEDNEGTHDCTGKGIYTGANGSFFVKLDGPIEDDRGPYESAREAVLATLPDIHGFSGSEYHSSVDPLRMEPDATVLQAVADLEAKVAGEDAAPGL